MDIKKKKSKEKRKSADTWEANSVREEILM